ncbi:MAG: DUF2061 domain-containing protein [Alphaproteobacteria bacterium]|nr:DUF2061 domain-containing protein [Alphaproteobacteria bacterium]
MTKTFSFAAVHFSVAFAVGYALTGSIPLATGLAVLEPLANTVAFFFHERAWRAWERVQGRASRAAPSSALPAGH